MKYFSTYSWDFCEVAKIKSPPQAPRLLISPSNVEKSESFTREGYLEEEKPSSYILSTLRDIVKNKSAKSMKFKDGSMKVDITTANMMLQVLDKINPMNKKKVMGILDKGGKGDFMKVHNVVMKALG